MNKGIIYTLVFIKNESHILLGLKKRGLGVNKWNGFGGKVENNESILNGAIRETKEECNLQINNLRHIGVVTYQKELNSKIDIVHIFTTNCYKDILKESEEMKPKWFQISNIPFKNMWPDAKEWFPLMLKDKMFLAQVTYNGENYYKNCVCHEVDSLESVFKLVDHITA